MGMISGLTYGIGNVMYGLKCAEYGILGAGITAPASCLSVLIYRLIQACMNKRRVGTFIDYANSNYWEDKWKYAASDDDVKPSPAINEENLDKSKEG